MWRYISWPLSKKKTRFSLCSEIGDILFYLFNLSHTRSAANNARFGFLCASHWPHAARRADKLIESDRSDVFIADQHAAHVSLFRNIFNIAIWDLYIYRDAVFVLRESTLACQLQISLFLSGKCRAAALLLESSSATVGKWNSSFSFVSFAASIINREWWFQNVLWLN